MNKRQYLIDMCKADIEKALNDLEKITAIYNDFVNSSLCWCNVGIIQNFQRRIYGKWCNISDCLKLVNDSHNALQVLYNDLEILVSCSEKEIDRRYYIQKCIESGDIISALLAEVKEV